MHRITEFSNIPDEASRGFEIEAKPGEFVNIFLVRKGTEVVAYENRCPHLGVNLDWIEHEFLDDEKKHIQCATHMALFNIDDGQCIAGPCVGDHLTKLTTRIEGDDVFVDLSGL